MQTRPSRFDKAELRISLGQYESPWREGNKAPWNASKEGNYIGALKTSVQIKFKDKYRILHIILFLPSKNGETGHILHRFSVHLCTRFVPSIFTALRRYIVTAFQGPIFLGCFVASFSQVFSWRYFVYYILLSFICVFSLVSHFYVRLCLWQHLYRVYNTSLFAVSPGGGETHAMIVLWREACSLFYNISWGFL
jgi:hypothetical protein